MSKLERNTESTAENKDAEQITEESGIVKETFLRILNSMCSTCSRCGVDCAGTTDPVWSGCVFQRPDNQMEITVVRSETSNYTPADLMYSWSQENNGYFFRTELGSARMIHGEKTWEYDHWSIKKNGDGTESITLYLQAERGIL